MSILPSNESKELQILDDALETMFSEVGITQPPLLPMTADVVLLPYIAKQYDFKLLSYNEEELRELLSRALYHRSKIGTVNKLKSMLDPIVDEATILEWFEYGGEPYRFKVDISTSSEQITQTLQDKIHQVISNNKNARSVLDELTLSYLAQNKQKIYVGAVGEVSCTTVILKGYSEMLAGTKKINTGAVGEVSHTAYQI